MMWQEAVPFHVPHSQATAPSHLRGVTWLSKVGCGFPGAPRRRGSCLEDHWGPLCTVWSLLLHVLLPLSHAAWIPNLRAVAPQEGGMGINHPTAAVLVGGRWKSHTEGGWLEVHAHEYLCTYMSVVCTVKVG